MSEHDDLERRLRAALSAKAEQITDADLDLTREAQVAEQVHTASHPRRRIFAGAGIAAAAAAIIGVGALAIHPGGQTPVNAVSHLSTSMSNTATTSTATADGSGTSQPRMTQQADTGGGPASISHLPTGTSSATASGTGSPLTPNHMSQSSPRSGLSAPTPPVMPTDLPQAGPLGNGKYAGPVPITDASGGATRMLNMPDGTKWQVVSRTAKSLTVRITDLPTDIEAYWSNTLPGLGWVQAGGGWQIPNTAYAVSTISDKGAFTVSW